VDPTFESPTAINDQATRQLDDDWWDMQRNKKTTIAKEPVKKQVALPQTSLPQVNLDEPLDLFERSWQTLDYPRVLQALSQECSTDPAQYIVKQASQSRNLTLTNKLPANLSRAYQGLTADSLEGVQERYRAVQEMTWILEGGNRQVSLYECDTNYKNRDGLTESWAGRPPPLGNQPLRLASILSKNDQVLQGEEIQEIVSMMNAMENVELWKDALREFEELDFVELPKLADCVQLNTTLHAFLQDALDDDGRLNGERFPVLTSFRSRIRTLKGKILSQLESLIALPSVQSKMALESGGAAYSEINGRLVIPLQSKYASSFGILLDSSRSGKTAYVEPNVIVGPTNELRQVENELRAEEVKIWRQLTTEILRNRQSLETSVMAMGQLDLCVARVMLGRRLSGQVPIVKDEGVIALKNAKHPVLVLRGIQNVVGSDIELGAGENQGLVLTGPNSGGKTVILKLLGLVALMARGGIPVPADAGKVNGQSDGYQPRVDFFNPVLADIGDIQSVGGDLSTFSGHMLVCREVLAQSGKNALVLMDELGSGTDPAQGVAIAQALLEALLETGSRVAITTHYMQLKQLAASDSRFSVAGMQFVGGRPTYKLLPGTVGESFAIAVAERLKLPQKVIDRATELLDSETRQMGDLIRELEDQKALVDQQVLEMEEKKQELARMELDMKEQMMKLERKMLNVRREEAKKFAEKLEDKERVLEDVLEKLKSDPSRRIVAKSWEDIKFVKRDALNEAESVPSVIARQQEAMARLEQASADLVPLAEMRDKPDLKAGDKLLVCKKGPLFGREAVVVQMLGSRIEVKVNGINTSLKLSEVAMPVKNFAFAVNGSNNNGKKVGKPASVAKAAARAIADEQKAPKTSSRASSTETTKTTTTPTTPSSVGTSVSIRTVSNTIDVRGCTLEEAKEKARDKFSSAILSGRSTVYILHGHGSGGVLRDKVRNWLRSESAVKSYGPAESADGGNAFTRVTLK
jgi:DNA mismatch repair protein MutS2